MSIFFVLWRLSWRYRVRPLSADQHAEGTLHAHTPVILSTSQWYCACGLGSGVRRPLSTRDKLVTLVILAVGVAALYVMSTIGGLVL